MALKLGKDSVFAYGTGGSFSVPTLTPVPIVRDGTVNLAYDEGDSAARGVGGLVVKTVEPTLLGMDIQVQILEDPTSATYAAMHSKFVNRTQTLWYAGSGALATAGNQYVKFDGYILGWKRGEPLNGVNTVDVTIKPCYSSNVLVVAIVP